MAESPEPCSDVCGIYLHRCRRCGYEGGTDVHTSDCPGCRYLAEITADPLGYMKAAWARDHDG